MEGPELPEGSVGVRGPQERTAGRNRRATDRLFTGRRCRAQRRPPPGSGCVLPPPAFGNEPV